MVRAVSAVVALVVVLIGPSAARAAPRCDTGHRSGWDLGVFEMLALEGAVPAYGFGLEVVPLMAATHLSRTSDRCLPSSSLSFGFALRLTWFEDVSFLGAHGLVEQTVRLGASNWQVSFQGQLGVFAARSTHGLNVESDSRFTWGPQLGGYAELRYFVFNGRMYVGLRAGARIGIEWVRPLEGTPLTFVGVTIAPSLGGTW